MKSELGSGEIMSIHINILKEIEEQAPKCWEYRNWFVNKSKTEKFYISRSSNDDWRKCKYVGSLLGTKEDINLRKTLTNYSYNSLKSIFHSDKILTSTKLRIFKALLESIFLYNNKMWGTTKERG